MNMETLQALFHLNSCAYFLGGRVVVSMRVNSLSKSTVVLDCTLLEAF